MKNWIKNNLLRAEIIDEEIIEIDGKLFLLFPLAAKRLFTKDMIFVLKRAQKATISDDNIFAIAFEFGEKFYYSAIPDTFESDGVVPIKFNDLKYFGRAEQVIDYEFVNLGIHTEYELLNGSHNAADWVKKAKFLGQNSLALCDQNTLGGTLSFQLACKKGGVKSILGESITIKYENIDDEMFGAKLFVTNKVGWGNLLRINKAINVDNDEKFIDESVLLKYAQGLVFVFTPDSIINSEHNRSFSTKLAAKYAKSFHSVYYQIDSVEYLSDSIDMKNLESFKFYYKELRKHIEPVLINDSYYLDKEHERVKMDLNVIKGIAMPQSKEQYFKTLDDSILKFLPLFDDQKTFFKFFKKMVKNTVKIAESCDFEIVVGIQNLPNYEAVSMSECGEDAVLYEKRTKQFWKKEGLEINDNEGLFQNAIMAGWEEKIQKKFPKEARAEYKKRLVEEISVIKPAGFCDYFLILWDAVKWSRNEGIIVGNARGSVAGSLVAYLLDITRVDPIEYGLLFERFLNKTRAMPTTYYDLELENGEVFRVRSTQMIPLKNGGEILITKLIGKDIDIDYEKLLLCRV